MALAFGFAFASGANDGATLASASARSGAMSPLTGVLVLALAAGAVPLAAGAAVARTLAHGLVSFEQAGGQGVLACAVAGALVVVLTLSRRGLPTSLTMALTGAIIGAGIGARLPTHWAAVLDVLGAGLLSPLLSLAVAYLLAAPVRRIVSSGTLGRRRARRMQVVAFLAAAVAYGANDAQKLVALLAVAMATTGPPRPVAVWQLGLAATFAAGALLFVRRVGARVAGQMSPVEDDGTLSALAGSTISVLGGAVLGLPLSSTQAVTSALLGSSARLMPSRVRWRAVRAIGGGWVLTLPSAVALGALGGELLHLA